MRGATGSPPLPHHRMPGPDANRARGDGIPAGPAAGASDVGQAVNELPQPQPPEAFGFLNVNPEPIIVVT